MTDPLGPRTQAYSSLADLSGFTGFVPTQCMKNASSVIPRVDSPIIALVGNTTEPVMASMVDYMTNLITFQKETIAFFMDDYPDFEFKSFATKDDLFSYLQSPDLFKTDDHKGVCYGFELVKDGDKAYTANLFFND